MEKVTIFNQLMDQFLTGAITREEHAQLQELVRDEALEPQLESYLKESYFNHTKTEDAPAWTEDFKKKLLQRIRSSFPVTHRVHFFKTSWFRYAAAVILIISGAVVWREIPRSAHNDGAVVATEPKRHDIQPGTNKATLLIGNQSVSLSDNKIGIAVGKAITYNDGERVAAAGGMLYLTTPRGGQYQVVLPDGSKVWLNAASSLKFPSTFTGNTREIEIAGEAYLEIARNSRQPFYVHTGRTTVQVLGTSFNINAYSDEEAEKTTLIEGSVRINNTILKPGQQAFLANNQLLIINNQSETALAWKNGLFDFNNTGFATAMRQLERWYDIHVKYEGKIPELEFRGAMQRNLTLTQLLSILKKMEINYRLEDRTLIIMN